MRCFGCAWVFPARGEATMGRLIRILALVSAGVLGLSACGTSTSSGKIGGTVHILGTWTGTEKDSFDAVMKPFTDQTGVKISFEATRDLDAILQTKIAAGNAPDVTAAPGIGTLIKLARAGKVVPLDDKLDTTELNANYGADWINLGKIDGKLITLDAWAALKVLVWCDPKAFAAKAARGCSAAQRSATCSTRVRSSRASSTAIPPSRPLEPTTPSSHCRTSTPRTPAPTWLPGMPSS